MTPEVTFPWLAPYLASVDVLERLAALMRHDPLRLALLPAFEAACELTRELADEAGKSVTMLTTSGVAITSELARAMEAAGVPFVRHTDLGSDL